MNAPTPPDALRQLAELEQVLAREILGQSHVLDRLLSVLRRGQLGLCKKGRPRGSFLFLGPTGTGKTETARVFSNLLFGPDRLIRLDMSEYQTSDSLKILLGSNAAEAGYLGLEHKRVRNGTLLLDEIEKANPRVLDICLQLLDEGRVTVATGETLDFSRFYIVLTSNIGGAEILALQHSSLATLERYVTVRALASLRPEFFARIDEVLVFHPLAYDTQLAIAAKFLELELKHLRAQGHDLSADAAVLPFIVRRGIHPRLGARPMRRAVEKLIGDAVAGAILRGEPTSGQLVVDSADELAIESASDKGR